MLWHRVNSVVELLLLHPKCSFYPFYTTSTDASITGYLLHFYFH